MMIQLSLPEFRLDPGDGYMDPSYDPGLCAGCGDERYGLMVKLAPVGWLHAEDEDGEVTCLQKAIDAFATPDPKRAWVGVARHVAKYPSRHSASTLRSVITTLADLAEGGADRG